MIQSDFSISPLIKAENLQSVDQEIFISSYLSKFETIEGKLIRLTTQV